MRSLGFVLASKSHHPHFKNRQVPTQHFNQRTTSGLLYFAEMLRVRRHDIACIIALPHILVVFVEFILAQPHAS